MRDVSRQGSTLYNKRKLGRSALQIVCCSLVGITCILHSTDCNDVSIGNESWAVQTVPPSVTILYGWPLRFAGCSFSEESRSDSEPWTDWFFLAKRRWILPSGLFFDLVVWIYMIFVFAWLTTRLRFRLKLVDFLGVFAFVAIECSNRLSHVFRSRVDLWDFTQITLVVYAKLASFFLVIVVCLASPRFLISLYELAFHRHSRNNSL